MINRTVKLLILADIFTVTGFGLIDPIWGIYMKEDLAGGSIFTVGFASTLFLGVKCLVQLPFSKWVDKHDHKVKWLVRGAFLVACTPLLYMVADNIWWFYAASVVQGIGSGLVYPTWLGLFSTHLDKHSESFEWSLYSTLTGLGTAATATVGAAMAQMFGFTMTFLFTACLAFIGCGILLQLERGRERHKKPSVLLYQKRRRSSHRAAAH